MNILKACFFVTVRWLFCIAMLVSGTAVSAQVNSYSILQYGAKADSSDNSIVIQQAVNDISAKGGGRLTVPAGRFITGPVALKTGVELYLAEGAVLLGSTKRLVYGRGNATALLSAKNQKNIRISGKGIIDGQGRELVKDLIGALRRGILEDEQWLIKRPTEKNRPKLVEFTDCTDISVKGITLKNAASWVQDYIHCDGVIIDSIRVESTEYWNNDGIDIVNSKNVRITNCYVDAADDAICLKSEGLPGWCENVYVSDCRLRSSASAFKLGTGSYGGFKKITVRNLTIFDTYRSAIALEAVDGGFLEDVDIRNVTAKNTGNAIFIRLGHRNNTEKYSTLKNVHISNVKVEVPSGKPDIGYPLEGPAQKYLHNVFPSSVTGLPGHPVQNVSLENIEIIYGGAANKEKAFFNADSLQKVPENSAGYPEFSMFGELPVWGLYIRHAEGISLKNIRLSYREDDFRPAAIFDDVRDLKIDGLHIPTVKTVPAVIFNKVSKPQTDNIILPKTLSKPIEIR